MLFLFVHVDGGVLFDHVVGLVAVVISADFSLNGALVSFRRPSRLKHVSEGDFSHAIA